MRTPIPISVRRELWAWRYAQRSFEHCRHCCDYVLREKMDDSHPLYYSMTLAAHVNYARPFKLSHGLKKLPKLILPVEKKSMHDQIIAARDKLYAHVDANESVTWDESPAVDVRVCFEAGGISIKCLEVTTKPAGFEMIADLSRKLEGKCLYHIGKIVKRYRKSFPAGRGEYTVCVGDNDPEYIKVEPVEC